MGVYYLKKDIDINDLNLQEEEVYSVKWLTIEEIKQYIENEKIRKGNINAFQSVMKYLEI